MIKRLLNIGLAIIGALTLSYLLGAAVLFFQLPTSDFLHKAFVGAQSWFERRQELAQIARDAHTIRDAPAICVGAVDRPGKTFDGYTLIAQASMAATSTQAQLINMRGEVVHRWSIAFSEIWPDPPHIEARVDDLAVEFFALYLYPNGDLIAVLHGMENLTNGYGLVKLDKDSKILWKYAGRTHHDVDVGDDGTVYAIQHAMTHDMPPGLEAITTPRLVDSIVLLSPEGRLLQKPIPLLEAFQNSPFAVLLEPLKYPHRPDPFLSVRDRLAFNIQAMEAMHTNCVHVLPRKLGAQFPQFKPGQVLVSLRLLDTIGVLDTQKAAIVWAVRGPWLRQHDPQFLENGHLLVFDNLGLGDRSRVLEYDPQTQALPWSCTENAGKPFFTHERGMSQRLPNGNTLIVNTESREIFEVTSSKEVVWSCSCGAAVATARRYAPEQIHFLKAGQRARP